jgi:hypothetical protein
MDNPEIVWYTRRRQAKQKHNTIYVSWPDLSCPQCGLLRGPIKVVNLRFSSFNVGFDD